MDPLEYLYGLRRFGMKLGLDTMRVLVDALGNPEGSYPVIHVGGTNGKGSVCAMLSRILAGAGYRVGVYTSPHLYMFNERIRVDGQDISDEDLARLTLRVKGAADRAGVSPTFFEFTTAMAFCHFSDLEVDVAVVEVGLGGRLDATNVVTPVLSVITNVSQDHEEQLGDSIESVAREKAGIVKNGVPLVTTAPHLFRKVCRQRGSALIPVPEPEVLSSDLKGQVVRVGADEYEMPLLGKHQAVNMATAITAARSLDMRVPDSAIREGLLSVTWPGRLEVVSEDPLVIADGAHNPAGMRSLSEFLEGLPGEKTLVVGLSDGHDPEEMLSEVAGHFSDIICTEGSFKPLPASEVARHCKDARIVPDVRAAVSEALEGGSTVIITGSLYLIPDAITAVLSATRTRTRR